MNGRVAQALNGNGKSFRANGQAASPRAESKSSRMIQQDQLLVTRCLAGETDAWSQMYERFHGSLLASIRAFLGRAGQDMHLVDEISARVWYALVRNQFALLARFDPDRGCRLSTFLSVIGKSEARLLLRSERRRKTRECVASRREMEPAQTECRSVLDDDDFLATLSPRERTFYRDILVATTVSEANSEFSQQNQWQLRHRVRKKLEQYLE
jgi:hypothetical protein